MVSIFPALAASPARAVEAQSRPVVVEIFLSQSCKASPPAGALAETLSARDDLVTLAWHVDYWNWLAGSDGGAWEDPYSQPGFADRHRAYNQRLRGKPRGMTPQAVVNGAATVSAVRADDVLALIDAARAGAENAAPTIDIRDANGGLDVAVAGGTGDALLVRFIVRSVTEISRGDNAGARFAEANVVTDVEPLGAVVSSASFRAERPPLGSGCAVILQEPAQGRVIAARYCP